MAQLIDDILKLSRITRCQLTLETVNLTEMAGIIADELRGAEPERKVEFIITKGLTTRGDSALLKVVLNNLLGNAWKFTGSHTEARIEFGSTTVNGKSTYFIRDDGAGFDMNYADKLFVTFQRLHTESEFPGTGIGLSLVQHIIHRHGGTIWAEGAVDQGATFWFTLG
jgi:light-regulated signal transduction histidine kinase (bacteriophytochrome)